MVERGLPISLPEVYTRINCIEDPVKRAGAQAFAGIYVSVLKLPEYRDSPLNRKIMRNRALRAKVWAMEEAKKEQGIPEPEAFDYSEFDAMAQQAGLHGVDLLHLRSSERKSLLKGAYGLETASLATLNSLSIDELDGVRQISYRTAIQIRRGLDELAGLSREQVEERIAEILRQIEEKSKTKHKLGEILLWLGRKIFADIGSQLPDDMEIESLRGYYKHTERLKAWVKVMSQLRPAERGVVNGALSVAICRGFTTVSSIRKASWEELERTGNNRAQFFHDAFGMHPGAERPLLIR